MKKIIYDFDGTLTTKAIPIYGFSEKCGIPTNEKDLMGMASVVMQNFNINMYEALFKIIFDGVKSSKMPLDNSTFCIGVQDVEYNPGVLDFFKEDNNDIEHYILTSGYDEYVLKTPVAKYVNKVYGTSYEYHDGKAVGVKELMSDTRKPEKIDLIADGNYNDVIYVGDGLTDIYAFKHILQKGGKAVLVHQPNADGSTYEKLKKEGVNVAYFDADYSKESALYNYLKEGESK